jgi:L-fuconolactonase
MIEPVVDSHVHVWANGQEFPKPWNPVASLPNGDASVESLQDQIRKESVSAAVLVQYIGYLWDNEYVARAIAARPDIFAGVCRVDPENPAAPDTLSQLVEGRGFQGVRVSLSAPSGQDWMNGPLAHPLFKRASELRIPVVVLTNASRLPDLIELLDRNPDVDVVIDHFADCDTASPEREFFSRRGMYG